MHPLMRYYSRQLHSYNFVLDIINLISEEIHKVIAAVLLGHFWASSFLFH